MSVRIDGPNKSQNRFISKSFNSHQFKQHGIIKEEGGPNLVKKMFLTNNKNQNQVSLDFDSSSAINQSCGQPKMKRPHIPFKESKSMDKSIGNNYKLASTLIFNKQVDFDPKKQGGEHYINVKSHKQLPQIIRNQPEDPQMVSN